MKLPELPLLTKGQIQSIQLDNLLKERLWSFGFITGNSIIPIRRGPKNNLTIYEINNTMLALRYEEAQHIIVQLLKEDVNE